MKRNSNGFMLTKYVGIHGDIEHWKFYLLPACMLYEYSGETQNIYTLTLAWAMFSVSIFVIYPTHEQRELF